MQIPGFTPAPPGSYYDVNTGQIKPWDFSVNIQDTPGYKAARQYEIDNPTMKRPLGITPPDYVQGWSNPDDWWYMPAYMGGGGLAQGAPIPGKSYGGSIGGLTMLAPGATGVDFYSNGQPVIQFGGGGAGSTPGINSAVQELLAKGLVPDIARQSAELSAGRGVGGSPAGASTAVRMNEQNYLTRLGLANSLLSGESQRSLPYQITPYQQQQLALQQQQLQLERDIADRRYPRNVLTGFRLPYNTGHGSGYGGGYTGNQTGGYASPGNFAPGIGPLGGNRIGGGLGGGSSLFDSGGGGFGGQQYTLEDMYDMYGFNDPGVTGDTSNWDWNYQMPEPPDFDMYD